MATKFAVIAESWREDERLAQAGIVTTIMANYGLERFLGSLGLSVLGTQVGDRYVLERMREQGFNVGGEPSGHVILTDYRRRATVLSLLSRCWRSSRSAINRCLLSAIVTIRCRKSPRTCVTVAVRRMSTRKSVSRLPMARTDSTVMADSLCGPPAPSR